MLKQVMVMRGDLGMSRGKLAAQVAHASELSRDEADPRTVEEWWDEYDGVKIVLVGESRERVQGIHEAASRAGIPTAVIRDKGYTELDAGTVTAAGVGPGPVEAIDEITGELPLLK